ncbi:MAG: AAA family ATPase, partial [Myxococcota bacterium]
MSKHKGNDQGSAESDSIIVQNGERQLAESMMQRIIHAADEDEYRDLRDQLWALGDAAIPTLRSALTSRYPRQRMAAACNLGRLGDHASLNELITLLRDPSSRVREMALFGLGVMGRPQAIEPILDCINDYDPDVRYRVLVALKDLQHKDLETVLVTAIKDDAYAVREQALSTLRDIATQKSLPYLLLALLEPEVKMQSLAETTLDRILPQATDIHYKKIRTVLTPRQTRLVMNYMESRNLQEVWPSLYNHLAGRLGTRRAEQRLDKYGRLLTNSDELELLERAFGRDDVVELMLDHVIDSGSSKSLLLIGDAGTGKTAVIHEFTRRLAERDATYKVLESNTSELMTGTRYLGDWETKLKEMMEAIQAEGDVILYLTNPDDLLGAGAHSKSNESFADFFKPYLQRGDLIMFAETTDDMLKGGLSRDPGFLRCFQQIRLDPMTDAETVDALTHRLPHLKGRGERPVETERDVLEDITDFARSFITRTQAPGRACDLLESVIEYVGRQRHKELPEGAPLVIHHSDVPRALSDTTNINLELLDDEIPLELDTWRNWFTHRLIDQHRAVDAVIDRLALVKAGLRDPDRPLGTMFLVGPTGVGKTYFAKLVAERVFGDAEHIIRFDLSEYQGRYAVEKLVGSPHDKDREGLLTEAIRQQPYGVLLLDEFEKADPDVFHLFLQVLDEGRLTDARGKTSDFRQAL